MLSLTRWMSPGRGEAADLTGQVRLLPTSIRAAPSSESVYRSSYSTPACGVEYEEVRASEGGGE